MFSQDTDFPTENQRKVRKRLKRTIEMEFSRLSLKKIDAKHYLQLQTCNTIKRAITSPKSLPLCSYMLYDVRHLAVVLKQLCNWKFGYIKIITDVTQKTKCGNIAALVTLSTFCQVSSLWMKCLFKQFMKTFQMQNETSIVVFGSIIVRNRTENEYLFAGNKKMHPIYEKLFPHFS